MIPVRRGKEPDALKTARTTNLTTLRQIARTREPLSDEIKGYRVAAEALLRKQHYKCCYCECPIVEYKNDVEHYRPKTSADRAPGSTDRHGYWWLAFTWSNLLFSCPRCNQRSKKTRFPLRGGDTALVAEQTPPGTEHPLLLDPAGRINPVEHIEYVKRRREPHEPVRLDKEHWFARPRRKTRTELGAYTIDVCKLNDPEIVELRDNYIDSMIRDFWEELLAALDDRNDAARLDRAFRRAKAMLKPNCAFVALTYDALRHFVPNADLAKRGLAWPEPKDVGKR